MTLHTTAFQWRCAMKMRYAAPCSSNSCCSICRDCCAFGQCVFSADGVVVAIQGPRTMQDEPAFDGGLVGVDVAH